VRGDAHAELDTVARLEDVGGDAVTAADFDSGDFRLA
jgi:hypothetical protein